MKEAEFNEHVQKCLPKLRNLIRKQIGLADQTDDVVQETLIKGWEKRATYKKNASFCTWLCSIGIRNGLDYLRSQKKWRTRSQVIYASECMNNNEWGMEIAQNFSDPTIHYDVYEHIAYCFSCVGRSLEPMDQAALILKDVLNLTSIEGGKVVGTTESVFRQHLTRARNTMLEKYDSLCVLVNKEGVCYQCKGLRDGFPDERKGAWDDRFSEGLGFDIRVKFVKSANIDGGKTQALHELFWKRTQQVEEQLMGDESVTTECGKE